MAWTAPRTWVVGEIVTAALGNTHWRDNLLETAPAKVTTKGDLVAATAANAIARVAVAANEQQLKADSTASTGVSWTARHLWFKGADIASAATITPGTDGNVFDITGTTGITAIATLQAGSVVIFQFDGALTITHNGTSLVLKGAANITTAAGDIVAFVSEGSGNWRELFRRIAASDPQEATQAQMEAETAAAVYVPPDLVRNSPGVAKGWCRIDSAGLLESPSYNVTSVTDTGAGDRTIVWNTDFSTDVYTCVGSVASDAAEADVTPRYSAFAVGSVRLTVRQSGSLIDRASSTHAFGDQ